MSNELIVIESKQIAPFYIKGDGVDRMLEGIAKEARSLIPNTSTTKGRGEITSNITKFVTKPKVYFESTGKDLSSERKKEPKLIDATRKKIKDFLSDLQDELRKPLADWENEQKRIAEELAFTKLLESAYEANDQFNKDAEIEMQMKHMQAIIDNSSWDKMKAEQAEQKRLSDELAEKQRLDREEAMKREAAEAARLEAERIAKENADRIEAEKQEALQREQQAILDKQEAERQAIAATERAKIEAEQAEKRRIQVEHDAELLAEANLKRRIQQQQQAEENTRLAAEQAKQKEILRQQEDQNRLLAEKKAREADKANRSNVMKASKEALMQNAGLTEAQAIATVKAIGKKLIPSITLSF